MSPAPILHTVVPLLLTGVRLHPPGRADKNLCRCFGAPARRVFPLSYLLTYHQLFCRCFGAPACRAFPDHLIIT